ncbi:hypothetical protein GCM10008018_09490 [Paenibacillus marchantiophytorum]|uniref:ATP-grasp domain-containing protein n=1 Tax=Paenibacillus marchantiophytorum TaxID=1619310 RepID=A0ABQ2BQ29_9BACL|nr:ATP-grasp domain-containing protein [Paenibacillus marchantiophytorum]GGI44917.1 hypothetical protein GCM10008018_09490 [Paenibacillus marchantiophytorum]
MAHLLMIESWVGASGILLPALLKSQGHTYTFVTRKLEHYQHAHSPEKHPVIRNADSVYVTETNDIPHLIAFLRPMSFDGVITVCDYYIEVVREVADALNLPCPFPKAVKTVRHKHLMRRALDRAGLANPKYRLAHHLAEVEEAAQDIGFPLVIKPVDLASSAFVRLIQNADELKDAYQALEDFPLNFRDQARDCTYLLEEFMTGEEVSVESVTYQGETTIIGITDKSVTGSPYFIENGHMFPAKLSEETRMVVTQFVLDALKAVDFNHGIAHTEVKITADGPRIVEINPRTAGNYIVELIQNVTDIHLLQAFVDISLGSKPYIAPQNNGITSSAVMFLVPPHGGKLTRIQDIDLLASDDHITRFNVEDCECTTIATPIDNACYLGYVITHDKEGLNARAYAEEAVKRMIFHYDLHEASE